MCLTLRDKSERHSDHRERRFAGRHGAAWLRWAEIDRLLVHLAEDDDLDGWLRYYRRHGLAAINRTRRGWERSPAR